MTVVTDSTVDASNSDAEPLAGLATWPKRLGAFATDVLLPLAVIATLALVGWTAPLRGWVWWVFVAAAALAFLAMTANRWVLPSQRQWSLGRALFGIAVRKRDGAPVGLLRLVLRDFAHLLDTAGLFIGWLWPLWDRRNRTFADLLLRTEVRDVEPPKRDMRRLTAAVMIAMAVLCALAIGLSYLLVYRPMRAVEAARHQIADQGPRIVEQLLTYNKDTLQQDFSRAQSLTTDSYRPQLTAQQRAIAKTGATSNEYWVVSSAVLPTPEPTPTRVSMLLAIQGQRGSEAKDLKFITATLRVDFEQTQGHWRVANLTVLKKPEMGAARK